MRLIDADALWNVFREKQNSLTARRGGYRFLDDEDRAEYDRLEITLAHIEDASEVDATSVVRGEWVKSDNYKGWLVCSACRDCYVDNAWVNRKKWRYCPNCGSYNGGDKA